MTGQRDSICWTFTWALISFLFSAPYVNYIQKDPGAPCSLTEALEYLQVDVLAILFEKDSQPQPPKYKPHNITVIAMEGCHSFVILDWARPLKDDVVSGATSTQIYHDPTNTFFSLLNMTSKKIDFRS